MNLGLGGRCTLRFQRWSLRLLMALAPSLRARRVSTFRDRAQIRRTWYDDVNDHSPIQD